MKTLFLLKSRNNLFSATGYYQEGLFTVCEGSRINLKVASHIRGGKSANHYRLNPEYVDENGILLKACVFTSPSTAAQFVTGTSRNGYQVWKDEQGKCLCEYR